MLYAYLRTMYWIDLPELMGKAMVSYYALADEIMHDTDLSISRKPISIV